MVHSYFPLASNQCAPLHEDDFVRLLFVRPDISGTFGIDSVVIRV